MKAFSETFSLEQRLEQQENDESVFTRSQMLFLMKALS
jgi:hypothetical protein